MIFWKSQFASNQSMREILKSRYPKTAFMYLLEKTTHPKVLKLGLYLPWVNMYIFDVGIWEIFLFPDFIGPQSSKIQYGCHFWPIKSEKVKFHKSSHKICRYSPREGINQISALLDAWFSQECTSKQFSGIAILRGWGGDHAQFSAKRPKYRNCKTSIIHWNYTLELFNFLMCLAYKAQIFILFIIMKIDRHAERNGQINAFLCNTAGF